MPKTADALPPMPVSVQPFLHQQRAYQFTLGLFDVTASEVHSRGAALLMEMGTGKSLTAIAVSGTMYRLNKVRRLLIVSPLSMALQEATMRKINAAGGVAVTVRSVPEVKVVLEEGR